MSLLPDEEEVESLLPPEEHWTDGPDLFVDGGGNVDWEAKKKVAIPKYKHLMPKKVIARAMGGAAIAIDLLFGFIIYTMLKKAGLSIWDPMTWLEIQGYVSYMLDPLNRRDLIMLVILASMMLLLTASWISAEKKVSSCPVCKKKNYKNYHVCSKCEYIFYGRDIINREIISIKLNNLDYSPAQVRQEFLERRLADLEPGHIRKVLAKNHFL